MITYDPHQWWSQFFDIKGSMVKEILWRVSTCVAWSALVVAVHPVLGDRLTMPLTIHSIVGTALGLLLVFRTNSAYDRFWEGRKLWGGIVNETRNLVRSSTVLLHQEPALQKSILNWTIAFANASMHILRSQQSVGNVKHLLSTEQIEKAERSNHPPMYCARAISLALRQARDRKSLSDFEMLSLDQNIQLLVDYLGGCERIRKTPLPFAYLVHLRRALVMYCVALPFALVADFGWVTVLATFAVSFVFFGIEEIGVEIEDPFGTDDNDLPLEAICATIESNLVAMYREPLNESDEYEQASASHSS